MYFDYDGKDPLKDKEDIYEVLSKVADRQMDLDTMAYGIDRRLKRVLPKHIKRLDVGAFHNVFAKDENELTHTILEAIAKKEVPLEAYALSFKVHEVCLEAHFKKVDFLTSKCYKIGVQLSHNKNTSLRLIESYSYYTTKTLK